METVSFDGGVDAAPARVALTDFTLTADGSTATGTLAVDLSGDRPAVTGDLALSALDLDALLAEPELEPEAAAAADASAAGGEEVAAAPPDGGTGTVAVPETEAPVPGRIDLALLDAATVDLSVDLGGLTIEGTEIGPTTPGYHAGRPAAGRAGRRSGGLRWHGRRVRPDRRIGRGAPTGCLGRGPGDRAGPATGRLCRYGRRGGRFLTLDLQATGRGETRQALADSLSGSAAARLSGGQFTVPNPEDGRPLRLEGVDLTLDMPSFDGPLSALGSAELSGEAVAFDLTAGNPSRAAGRRGEQPGDRSGRAARPARLRRDGQRRADAGDQRDPRHGRAVADRPGSLAAGGGPGRGAAGRFGSRRRGRWRPRPCGWRWRTPRSRWTTCRRPAPSAVELAGARPSIHARLSTGYLDLDSPPGRGRRHRWRATQAAAATAGSAGTAGGDGWSNQTIDLSPLTAVDVDAVVELREGMPRGRRRHRVDHADRAAPGTVRSTPRPPSVPVFGGTVTADVGVTAGQTPSWDVALQAAGGCRSSPCSCSSRAATASAGRPTRPSTPRRPGRSPAAIRLDAERRRGAPVPRRRDQGHQHRRDGAQHWHRLQRVETRATPSRPISRSWAAISP